VLASVGSVTVEVGRIGGPWPKRIWKEVAGQALYRYVPLTVAELAVQYIAVMTRRHGPETKVVQ
jgi:hypothetical protein